jgi:hypothetical protein
MYKDELQLGLSEAAKCTHGNAVHPTSVAIPPTPVEAGVVERIVGRSESGSRSPLAAPHSAYELSAESRQHVLSEELKEAILIGTNLVNVDVVESSIQELLHCVAILLRVGPAHH